MAVGASEAGLAVGFRSGLESARQRRVDEEERQRQHSRDDLQNQAMQLDLARARRQAEREPDDLMRRQRADDLNFETSELALSNMRNSTQRADLAYEQSQKDLKRKADEEGLSDFVRTIESGADPQYAMQRYNQVGSHKISSVQYDRATQKLKVVSPDGQGFDGTLPVLKQVLGLYETPIKLGNDDRIVTRNSSGGYDTAVPPASGFTDEAVEDQAQLIANGQAPAITGYSLSKPFGQSVMSRVAEISRQRERSGGNAYSAGDFASKSKAMRDFNTGQQGNAVRFMNTAISHINTLQDLGGALDNGNVQVVNRFKSAWKTQTGESAPTSFQAARDIVANEVVKAVTASGGALADRQEAQQQISAASSWTQLAGVADTWKLLLAGQLSSLRLQYEHGTGLKDFDKKLYPETLRELSDSEDRGGRAPAPQRQAPQAALDHLAQHPELAPQFKAKYGYLPGR